jgi:hypothetical protein
MEPMTDVRNSSSVNADGNAIKKLQEAIRAKSSGYKGNF